MKKTGLILGAVLLAAVIAVPAGAQTIYGYETMPSENKKVIRADVSATLTVDGNHNTNDNTYDDPSIAERALANYLSDTDAWGSDDAWSSGDAGSGGSAQGGTSDGTIEAPDTRDEIGNTPDTWDDGSWTVPDTQDGVTGGITLHISEIWNDFGRVAIPVAVIIAAAVVVLLILNEARKKDDLR